MKQFLGTLIFALMALVVLSGAVPELSSQPPLERVAHEILACVHLW
jgi:hypothetical protein